MCVSVCGYVFSGWYVYHMAPKAELNRVFALWSAFIAAWVLVFLALSRAEGPGILAAWYRHHEFSYLAKSAFLLYFALALSGAKKRPPAWLFAALSAVGGALCAAGIADLLGLNLAGLAFAAWTAAFGAAPPWRAAYSLATLPCYVAAVAVIVGWHRRAVFKRERSFAFWTLVLTAFVIGVNLVIGWLPPRDEGLALDLILFAQLFQPFTWAFAISHFKALKPTLSIVSEEIGEAVALAVLVLDHRGLVVSANRAACELSGFSEEESAGRDYRGIFPRAEQVEGLLDPARIRYIECELGPEGKGVPVSLSASPVLDAWKDCVGYVLIGQTIVGLDGLEERLSISKREKEVCLLLVRGLSNQEIGERLFISSGTVKNHVYNIYEKTGVKNRVELARLIQ
jgi:PAS domain S-box-containing protein